MSDRKENGSITVEAALFIPMFLFAFMCIFSLISCVRAQVLIQYSVDQAAKEVAEYSYILEKTGVLDAYKVLLIRFHKFVYFSSSFPSFLQLNDYYTCFCI